MSHNRQKIENVSSVDDEDVMLWTISCPLQENDILNMRFVSGKSPYDFWLRFNSDKELKKIRSGIQNLFERNVLQPLKSLEMLGGDFCICNGRDYFRGRIIDLCTDSPTSYVILNVDNGGILKVKKSNMYRMTKEIAKIPVQAINCCLKGDFGDRTLWDACIVKMFHQVMVHSSLVVTICSVPTETCSKFVVKVDVHNERRTESKINLSNWITYTVLPILEQKRTSKSANTLKLLYDSPRSEAELESNASLKEYSVTESSSKTREVEGRENNHSRNLYAKDNANGISNSTKQKSYPQEPPSNATLESNSFLTVKSMPLHAGLPHDQSNVTEQSSSFLNLNSLPVLSNIKEKANVQQEPPSAEQQSSGFLILKDPLLHSMSPLTDEYVPPVLQYQSPPTLVQMDLSSTVHQPMYANALQIQPPLLQINPFHNSGPPVALQQQNQSQSSQLQITSPVQIRSDQNTSQSLAAVTYRKSLHSNVEDTQKGRGHSTCISLKDKENEAILITNTLRATHHQMETASVIKETSSTEAEAFGEDFLVYKQEATPNVNSNSTDRMSKVSLRDPNFKFVVGGRYGAFVVHINDPDDFYVHVVCKDTIYIETLDQQMTENYKTCSFRFRNKEQAKIMLYESWCAVFYQDTYLWHRGKVINWKDDNDIALEVLYVDYGEVREVDLSMIKPLKEEYTKLPICATRCRLANIQPPTLQENSKHSTWPSETIELFKVLTVRDRLHSIVVTNISNPISVLLVTEDELVINKTLLDWEYAIAFKPTKSDPSLAENRQKGDRLRDSGKIAGDYAKIDGKENIPPSRNPITDDYFAVDNIQNHDDENACYAVSGYIPQDEQRICKFYAKNGHCVKGVTCTKEHSMLNPDGWTMDQEIVLQNPFNNLVLPPVGTLVTVEVTGIYTLNIFYAHIFWKGRTKEKDEETLLTLNKSINSKYNVTKMKRLHITPAVGQLVLAMSTADGYSNFFRARVIDTSIEENMVQVVYVDYGNTEWVSEKDIRDMESQYLHLPFQALECFISNVRPKTENEKALLDLSDLILGRQLNGVLISKNILGQAEIELWDGNQKISDKLIKKGYADYKESPSILSEDASIIPG